MIHASPKPDGMIPNGEMPADATATTEVCTPDTGTTQSATSGTDSSNYSSYEEMVAAYKADIDDVYAGDAYGKNIVALNNPLNDIGTYSC